ncbi:4142_t:CDS:1 [Ambispora leptoticha]|uniref:4142_t:CDS:1 n=1 Tax=Ambispora leptoticha TaxID=144679 RepID=A0A9N9C7M0_9GLOM|nr:4142_t:CDS:1 [Ambispora leptoticha]
MIQSKKVRRVAKTTATNPTEAAKKINDSCELNESFNSSTEFLSSSSLQISDISIPPSSDSPTLLDFDISDEQFDSLSNQQQNQTKFVDYSYSEEEFKLNENGNNYINNEDINLNLDLSSISKESSPLDLDNFEFSHSLSQSSPMPLVEQPYKQISSISKRSSKIDDLDQLHNLEDYSFNEQYVTASAWFQFISF